VVDLRQELHFKQVFAVFGKIGFPEQAARCFHLKYNFVELPDGAMSSRKGNIVPIMDLIDNMKKHVVENYLKRYEDEWDAQYIRDVSDMVAQGAIKYGMNVMDPNKKIVFKMEDWLKLDGESGPYIQYSHARICSLLEKLSDVDLAGAVKYELLTEPIEVELMLKLAQFSKTIETGAQSLKTSILCGYLYDTAKLFNSFYHDCPIGKLENQEHKKARLTLAKATGNILKEGLAVLGIPAPTKM
jgi:arginyl-tRNA synthetase